MIGCWTSLIELLVLFAISYGANYYDPGREKFHHYKMHPRHTSGLSDEWLGVVHKAIELDYSQVPIVDPDPRKNFGKVPIEEERERDTTADNSQNEDLWYRGKPLPFKRGNGDGKGLKVLIVTIDTRSLAEKKRDANTISIDNTAKINHHYAKAHGYDYLYISTTKSGSPSTNGTVCNQLKARLNVTSLLKVQCPRGGYKGKYDVATYHIGRKFGRASSWNKLPPLIYLADQYGTHYDYFLYIDSDVILNSKYVNVSISEKLAQWSAQPSHIGNIPQFPVWGQPDIYKAHLLALTNYPWRDDYPCAGVFLVKPDRTGLEMLIEWWDYHLPLKNLFDFMEQDALWYMKENGGNGNLVMRSGKKQKVGKEASQGSRPKFKVNNASMTMIYEAQFSSYTHGVGDLFFVHMANYVEQKERYVNVMLKDLEEGSGGGLEGVGDIKKKNYLELNTIGLSEYVEQTRLKYSISLRPESYYPSPRTGKDDEVYHDPTMSTIIPYDNRKKFEPPIGRLYNGYAMGFRDFRSVFYVWDDRLHEFPNWDTFVGMGFDLDHMLQFRDFGRRKPCREKAIPPGWPILDIKLQKKTGQLFDYTATSNGSLDTAHPPTRLRAR